MVYRLIVLLYALLWALGFIDLVNHTSMDDRADVLGRYSLPFFVVLILYASGFLVWAGLLFVPSAWLSRGIAFIQKRLWLALTILVALAGAVWSLFAMKQFVLYPGLHFSLLALALLTAAVMIFARWGRRQVIQPWRKIAALLIAALLIVEAFTQLMAFLGIMPGIHRMNGRNVPYGRVYYNQEGLGNGITNRYGWYYPEFRLASGSHRVVLVGDSFIQALQIKPSQHLGVKLQALINAGTQDDGQAEVLGLGHPGFGPGVYMDIAILEVSIDALEPDEIVAFINLGSDLKSSSTPAQDRVYFYVDANGSAKVHPDSHFFWHDVAHYVIFGYESFDLVRTLGTHYLTPQLIKGITGSQKDGQHEAQAASHGPVIEDSKRIPSYRGYVTEWGPRFGTHTTVERTDLLVEPGVSNHIFEIKGNAATQEAYDITQSLIKLLRDYTKAKGITLRLVTIPVFPHAFYTQYQGDDWVPEMGDYDLFLPERVLREFAEAKSIPFLSMGQYMKENGLTVEDIQRLYYADGQGHLTPEGHQLFADAVYQCFYSSSAQENAAELDTTHTGAKTGSCFVGE
jgi:hypothetical protein